jgi:predicted sugar kinase
VGLLRISTTTGVNMNAEVLETKVLQMESDIKEIKNDIKGMPEEIANKINTSVDMKIKLAIAETEKKYMGKFIALLIGLIGEAVGLIISFIK